MHVLSRSYLNVYMELQINKVLPRVQPGTGKNMTYIKPDYTYVLSQIKIVDLGWFKGVRMRKKKPEKKEENPALLEQNPE